MEGRRDVFVHGADDDAMVDYSGHIDLGYFSVETPKAQCCVAGIVGISKTRYHHI